MPGGKQGLSIKDLYGGRSLTPKLAQRAKAELERRGKLGFKQRARRWVEGARLTREATGPLLDLVAKDKRAEKTVAGMRRLQKQARVPRIALLRIPFPGRFWPIGATLVPPYDIGSTWSELADGSATPGINEETADTNSGEMSLDLDTNDDDFSGVLAESSLGIFFFPPWPGRLQVTASVTYTYDWGVFCHFADAHVQAALGIRVLSFDAATGGFTGFAADSSVQLWDKDESWPYVSHDSQDGLNSMTLSVPPFQVDSNHEYIIAVRCEGEADALGWGLFWGSGAFNTIQVAVNSISWELQPNPPQALP